MALRARNASPSGRATLNPQSTCHGPRPGPKLPSLRIGSGRAPCVPWSREHEEKDPRPEEKKMPKGEKKTHLYTWYNICVYIHIHILRSDWTVNRFVGAGPSRKHCPIRRAPLLIPGWSSLYPVPAIRLPGKHCRIAILCAMEHF